MKDERGITLIVLVITIIVLFILAGVSLRQIIVDNAAPLKSIMNETEYQRNMVQNENKKMNSVISNIEEEWGIS